MRVEDVRPMDRVAVDVKMARQLLGGIGNNKIYEMLRDGELERLKLGTRTLVSTESIRNWIERLRAERS